MRTSRFFISTLKEAPADAEVISHQLMLRAGMIKRLAGGIYTWMPVGLRVVRKVERVVREEMDRAGAIELSMPNCGRNRAAGKNMARNCYAARIGTSAILSSARHTRK